MIRFRWFAAILAALIVLLLAVVGCGGTHSRPVAGHACNPKDYVMQCAPVQKQHPVLHAGAPVFAQGVDFAWSCPSPSGRGFGASYFSYDLSKNWTLGCVNAYHRASAGTVGVWEAGAGDATSGYNTGYNQAYTARRQARAVGEPDSRPIDYAIDCDCSGGSVDSYFRGADAGTAAVLHVSLAQAVNLTDAYGGYYPLQYLCARGLVGHTNWQTYAWSRGLWLPASCAPLEQYLNDGSVDYDRAIAPDYGQWPAPGPPPPPPDPYAFIPHGPFQDGSRLVDEYWTVKHWDQDRCRNPVRRHQCVVGRDHLIFLRGRISWLAHHRWGTPAHPNWAPNSGGQRWRAENLRINAISPTGPGQL